MIAPISLAFVISVHDAVLEQTGVGRAGADLPKLEGILGRIDNQIMYRGIANIFEIAAWYGVAIAKGHGFADANKRTALVTMLTFLDIQGVTIQADTGLDDLMVSLVESTLEHETLTLKVAVRLFSLIAR